MTSTTETQNLVVIAQDVNMIDISVKILENLATDQLEKRFVAIEKERRRAHLRLRLAEAEVEQKIDFLIAAAQETVSKP